MSVHWQAPAEACVCVGAFTCPRYARLTLWHPPGVWAPCWLHRVWLPSHPSMVSTVQRSPWLRLAPCQRVLQGAVGVLHRSCQLGSDEPRHAGVGATAMALHGHVGDGAAPPLAPCLWCSAGALSLACCVSYHRRMDGDTKQDLASSSSPSHSCLLGLSADPGASGCSFPSCCQLPADSSESFAQSSCPLAPVLLNTAVAVAKAHSLPASRLQLCQAGTQGQLRA